MTQILTDVSVREDAGRLEEVLRSSAVEATPWAD